MQNNNSLNQLIEYVNIKLDLNTVLANRIVQWLFTPNAPKPTREAHVYWSNASCEYVLLSTPPMQKSCELVITSHDYKYLFDRQIPHIDQAQEVLLMFRPLYKQHLAKYSPQSGDTQKESIPTQSSVNEEPIKMDMTQSYGIIYTLDGVWGVCARNVADKSLTYRSDMVLLNGRWKKTKHPRIYNKKTYGYDSIVLCQKETYVSILMTPLTNEKARLIGVGQKYVLVFINNLYVVVDKVNMSTWVDEPIQDMPELYIPVMGDYVEVEHPQYSAYGKIVALNDQWIAIESPNLVITTFEIEQCSIVRSSCKKTLLRSKLMQYRYDVDNLEMYVDSIDEMYQGS